MYRTIIAGCNGRERGRGAVSLAHAIASATGGRLRLVGVHHNPPLPFPGSYATQHELLEHELRTARDELAPQALIRLEADILPAHALRRVAAAEKADLLSSARGTAAACNGSSGATRPCKCCTGRRAPSRSRATRCRPAPSFTASASASMPRPSQGSLC
jgi:hypothetical protein